MEENVKAAASGKQRIAYIDLAESLAMLFVVAYHLSNCSYKFLYEPGALNTVTYFVRCIFVSCVPVFLVLNGFLMFRHSFDLKKHLLKTLRYLLLALFWGVVTLVIYDRMKGIAISPWSFLTDLLSWRGGVIHLWYLGALVIIYLLFPLLKILYDKDRKLLWYVIAVTAVVTFGNRAVNLILTLIGGLRGAEQPWVFTIDWFSQFDPVAGIPGYTLVYFCLGAFLPDLMKYLERFPRRRLLWVSGLGLAISVLLHGALCSAVWASVEYYFCPIWEGYDTLTAAAVTLFLLVLCSGYQGKKPVPAKVLKLISVNTLGIYLMHMSVVYLVEDFLDTQAPVLHNLPGNLLCAAVIVALCLGLTWVMKKIPGLKWLVS